MAVAAAVAVIVAVIVAVASAQTVPFCGSRGGISEGIYFYLGTF